MAVDRFAFRVAATNFAVLSRAVLAIGALHLFVLQSTPSVAESAYAFGQGGAGVWVYGYGSNANTQSEAQTAALQKCNVTSISCSIIATFRKTCFAIAVQNGSNGWAVRYGPDLPSARSSALQGCSSMGQSCFLKDSFCDFISEQETAQTALDQANREFEEYKGAWNICFAPEQTEGDAAAAIRFCDQALTYPKAAPADRDLIVRERALLQDYIQRIHNYNQYSAQRETCEQNYQEDACTAALRSPLADDNDREFLSANLGVIQEFKDNLAACKTGSASACDIALRSLAADDDDRRNLEQWRASAPFFDRTTATLAHYWNVVVWDIAFAPLSTVIATFIAALLAIVLIGVFVRQRRSKFRGFAYLTTASLDRSQPAPDRAEPQIVPSSSTSAVPDNMRAASKPVATDAIPPAPEIELSDAEPDPPKVVAPDAAAAPNAPPKLDKAAIKHALKKGRVEFEI